MSLKHDNNLLLNINFTYNTNLNHYIYIHKEKEYIHEECIDKNSLYLKHVLVFTCLPPLWPLVSAPVETKDYYLEY